MHAFDDIQYRDPAKSTEFDWEKSHPHWAERVAGARHRADIILYERQQRGETVGNVEVLT